MASSPVSIGTAAVDITPDRPVNLGGYGIGPFRKCTGIASRLYARALAVGIGDLAIAIASIDTQGLLAGYKKGPFGHRDIEAAAKGLRPELKGVLSASSHSHTAPDSTGVWGGLPPAELERIAHGTTDAIVSAIDSLEPAKFTLGTADATDLLRNQCDFEPHSDVDGRVTVLEATSEGGRGLGRLIHFAAHATVASGSALSADWPGAVARYLDEIFGGTTVVLPGAIGRTQPAIRGDGSTGAVMTYASAVGDAVLRARKALRPLDVTEPRFAAKVVNLRLSNPLLAAVAPIIGRRPPADETDGSSRSLLSGFTSEEVRITAIGLGPLLIAGFPGEAYPNIAWELESALSFDRILTVSLACDQIGYLIYPENSYGRVLRDAYKNDNSYFCPSPRAGSELLQAMVAMAESL